jgi:5-methylcytosine-specific restriction endonuclease McrA
MAYLTKPSALDRDVAKARQRQARAKLKASTDRQVAAAWTVIRKAVYARDKGCSRYSGTPVFLYHPDPEQVAHTNHIVFRSAGGSDELSNLVTLTPREHEMVHARHPKYVLDITGDANDVLTFTKRAHETGAVVDLLESPCPR